MIIDVVIDGAVFLLECTQIPLKMILQLKNRKLQKMTFSRQIRPKSSQVAIIMPKWLHNRISHQCNHLGLLFYKNIVSNNNKRVTCDS